MLNGSSISLRLERLDESIRRLRERRGISLEDYRANWEIQDAVERNFQVAVECCAHIASHLLVSHGLGRPPARRDVFLILSDAGLLDPAHAEVMVRMVQLRNRLVHLYWDVDPERMHDYLHHDVAHLERFRAFTAGMLEKERSESED